MIETPTTLILGAGASEPYGYPVGNGLRTDIISSLREMVKNNNGWVNELNYSKDFVSDFAHRLAISDAPSIDTFLEKNKNRLYYSEFGKISIVDIISRAENNLPNFQQENKNKNEFEIDHWYKYMVKKLSKLEVDNFFENLRIISYNYDRSLENYLFNPLLGYLDTNEAVKIMNKLKIIHMYGRLDPLQWEGTDWNNRYYGEAINSNDLFKLSKTINLIHETKESHAIKIANDYIDESGKVYFLGLDLHNNLSNIEMLDTDLLEKKEILVTAYGLEEGEIVTIKNFFKEIQHPTFPGDPKYTVTNSKSLQAIKKYLPFKFD
ncbi:MAG: hypothetical protein LLF83_03770 [Methanobacterium sp.]|nr:hypothetical protein [Methanobacterium sp.]